MRKLKILQIYDFMQLGGAETHIITLAQELEEIGHNVQIVSSYGPAVSKIHELGIKFHDLDIFNPSNYFMNAEKILEIIEFENIDIIHVHPFHSQIVIGLVKLIKNIPTVTTIHGAYKTPSVEGLQNFFERYILVSEETSKFHIDNRYISKELIHIIHNSVPVISNSTIEICKDGILKIVYISRIDKDKLPSIVFFINCIEEIIKIFNVDVKIIGNGNEYNYIVTMVNELNEKVGKQVIHIIPGSTNVLEFMKAADIVVGVGRVLLEALSVKKIPICIGNKNYVGIINRDNLMGISEVNFTDRNTNRKLLPEYFIKDLMKIKEYPQQSFQELNETIGVFENKFNIKISAEKHNSLYKKVLEDYSEKKYNISDLSKFKVKIKEVENIIFAYELKKNGQRYLLDNVKETRILIVPNFLDENDNWSDTLVNYLKNSKLYKNTTLVIRINNEFHNIQDDILNKIYSVLELFVNSNEVDILVDCDYFDNVSEILFLYEMCYFIPTNSNQKNLIYLVKLLGGEIIQSSNTNIL